MKKRDEIQTFHTSTRVAVGSTRGILASPQQMNTQNISGNASQSQYQILNVLRDTGGSISTQNQNIQYTYTSPSITVASNMQKSNISHQSAQNQALHLANSVNILSTNPNRPKASSSGTLLPSPISVSSPTGSSTTTATTATTTITPQNISGQNFPRLKVEDALSYLDQVKYKFGNQPQVYNDFLDIMKEFKSQSIDTPGVIQRVSNLFKGHPELIVGFNTFLPPGYKIEVQANDQGFAYQVSVSVPSPSGNATISTQHSPPTKFVQGSQQPPINIISHSQNVLGQQSDQKSVQSQHISGINVTQNFSRERSDRLSVTSATANCQPSQQQSQNSSQMSQSPLGDSTTLHRMQPIFQNDNQPVQFNQAIVYVNKIKCRFQEQPEKYKHFLRILHKYQNEQRKKDGKSGSPLTESEVFKQVAHLFDNQEDLLREFGQFLPDASPISSITSKNVIIDIHEKVGSLQGSQQLLSKAIGNNLSRNSVLNPVEVYQNINSEKEFHTSNFGSISRTEKDLTRNILSSGNQKYSNISGSVTALKRPSAIQINHLNRSQEPPMKRHKPIFRDVSYADAARSGTLQDYAFFDKVRETLRSPDVYDNFLRCLTLYNQEIVSKTELITLVTPFLSKEPELLKKFHEFLKFSAQEPISLSATQRQDHRIQTDTAAEIDVAQCKRLGTSYCALPKSSEPKKCSGRTALCREVLNDIWVSFPSWSEDSTFNTSRKTQYEEFIYRCEDERFELDVVIETNSATIRVLEGVQKRMSKMSPDELARFKLDDSLGGTSQTIHQRALKRIYGDKSPDIIEGLKKNPNVAVPVVLRRLKAKEEEWREAQKSFNQQWREQNEKYYLKSLDHQGMNFKHADIKALRSKSLMNQIETAYEERNETSNIEPGPHLILHYKDKSILDDASNLLIHHVKRQTGIQKLEKARIKHILRQFVPELFFAPRQPLSEDEKDDVFPFSIENDNATRADKITEKSINNRSTNNVEKPTSLDTNLKIIEPEINKRTDSPILKVEIKSEIENTPTSFPQATGSNILPLHATNTKHPDEAYTLFFANSNWYYFLRLHAILCERLRTMYEKTQMLAAEEEKFKTNRKESVAVALRLKPQNEFDIPEYYPAFLDMLKSLLDGNMDSTTYEDKLRDMYGIHAYIAFTLDRVVSNAVRQLQFCVTERNALECFELYQLESQNHATGGHCSTAFKRSASELSYQRRIESNLQEEMYFKILIFKIDCRVTVEMLENDTEDASTTNYEHGHLSSKYIERFTNPALHTEDLKINSRNNSINGLEIEIKEEKADNEMNLSIRKPLYLQRNIRSFNKKIQKMKYHNGEQQETCKILTSADSMISSIVAELPSKDVICSTTVSPPILNSSKIFSLNVPERIGQSNFAANYFIDDQEQVKLNYQTYKTVFCNTTNKGYILYRYNSLKKAKQSHMKVTKIMSERFNNFLRGWLSQHSNELQKMSISDWLHGRNQLDFILCKTTVKNNNNILETPYCFYNRYVVEYPLTNVENISKTEF